MRLKGKVALITGASRGIGKGIAEVFAEEGADVAVNYISCGQAAEDVAAWIRCKGRRAITVKADVANRAEVESMVNRVWDELGPIDILVNNAGIGGFDSPLHELPPEEWDRILNTNLRGVYYTIRAFAPMMIRAQSGHIINISSLAGKNALRNGAAYAASKWGLNGLSYSVAEELRGYKVRVSVICPGSVETELGPHTGKDAKKMLQPNDVAHAVVMLVMQAPQSFISEVLIRPTQKP